MHRFPENKTDVVIAGVAQTRHEEWIGDSFKGL